VILLIDNYDSFVFNLARYLRELGVETRVVRNDELSVVEAARLRPEAIVLSPGPCTPNETGICIELVEELLGDIPIFGVCLGHQAVAQALGADVVQAPEPVHGRTSMIAHEGSPLFAGIPSPFRATRYHSLIVDAASVPSSLQITARTADGLVMALEHDSGTVASVQFHPESILTSYGHRLLANFLTSVGIRTIEFGSEECSETPPIGTDREPLFEVSTETDWSDKGSQHGPLHW
jgi:anthranilate synthase/aminodeoxychorismate synthase-like glutamine amidotransferase